MDENSCDYLILYYTQCYLIIKLESKNKVSILGKNPKCLFGQEVTKSIQLCS